MAFENFIQGEPIPYSMDLTSAVGVIDFDAVLVEIYKNYQTALSFKYPLTAGFGEITKTDNIYSLTITSDQTKLLLGEYGIELTFLKSDKEVAKGQSDAINITREAK